MRVVARQTVITIAAIAGPPNPDEPGPPGPPVAHSSGFRMAQSFVKVIWTAGDLEEQGAHTPKQTHRNTSGGGGEVRQRKLAQPHRCGYIGEGDLRRDAPRVQQKLTIPNQSHKQSATL